MLKSRPISVWFNPQELVELDRVAADAGYEKVSTFIKDKVLSNNPVDSLHQDKHYEDTFYNEGLESRLAAIENNQKKIDAILSIMLALIQKRSTTKEISDVIVEGLHTYNSDTFLSDTMPNMAEVIHKFITNS